MDIPVSMFYISAFIGELIYHDKIGQATGLWNLTATDGGKVTFGNYIAVIKSKTGKTVLNKLLQL
jgi:hypothetical protein